MPPLQGEPYFAASPVLDDPLRYRAFGKIKTIFKPYKFIHDIVLMLETMRY
jgi:hypothetical protein